MQRRSAGDPVAFLLILSLSIGSFQGVSPGLYAQETDPDLGAYAVYPPDFSVEDFRADYTQMREILESTHPALYDYNSKEVMDSLLDANYAAIDEQTTYREFILLISEVLAHTGCGHTSLWIPWSYWEKAPDGLFPLKLLASGDDVYVRRSIKDRLADSKDTGASPSVSSTSVSSAVPVGSRLLAVNGQPIEHIMDSLVYLSSSDGFNLAYRTWKSAEHFSLRYAHAFGFADSFDVVFEMPGLERRKAPDAGAPDAEAPDAGAPDAMVRLASVTKQDLDASKEKHSELSYYLMEDGITGLLTINSFGYYEEVDMFHNFVDSVFREIEDRGTRYLVMDLRGNGGGDPFCASYLWGYLQPDPTPYFADHYGRYDTLANPIPLPENHFTGELYTLIDGACFSTTGHFLGLLSYHQVGLFAGSESGATYTCTGNATYPALDSTGLMVGTARIMRYTAAVKDMDPTRGIVPDIFAEPDGMDLAEGRDIVLETVVARIQENEEALYLELMEDASAQLEPLDDEQCESDVVELVMERMEREKSLGVGDKAPDFQVELIGGRQWAPGKMKHDYLLLCFWASDCDHCMVTLPKLGAWLRDANPNVDVLGMSVDRDREALMAYLKGKEQRWMVAYEEGGWQGPVSTAFAVYATPAIFILDRDLNILARPKSYRQVVKAYNRLK